ncbi:MAG: response regulator [Armatimonadetes bacterium]|nr:response regulator [Armatimonadota bacterium]
MARILIVEDEQDVSFMMQQVVAVHGHEALVADDGSRALEILDEGPVDLIILDLMMPGMDGYQVMEELQARGDRPPVIVYSGYLGSVVEDQFPHAEMVCSKPVNVVEFLETIERVLETPRDGDA